MRGPIRPLAGLFRHSVPPQHKHMEQTSITGNAKLLPVDNMSDVPIYYVCFNVSLRREPVRAHEDYWTLNDELLRNQISPVHRTKEWSTTTAVTAAADLILHRFNPWILKGSSQQRPLLESLIPQLEQ